MTKNFDALGLTERGLDAVERLGYESPTPVQEQALPLILEGRDIVAAAQTGTGKTAAFSLPAMDVLGHAQRGQGPLMLVVTPTRELAQQIADTCEIIGKATNHQVLCIVGGVPYDPQINALVRGTDVLIATPGRLIDLMERKAIRLNQVEIMVVDEADRMLDMGFWPAMKRIVGAVPRRRQTLLFSATIDRHVLESVEPILHDPAFVEIAHKGETAETVDQYIVPVAQTQKPALLKAVLDAKGGTRIIVFARTRHRADSCTRNLRKAGFSVEAIHSDRTQNQRRRALDNFSTGKTDILVATDVLARGIDVAEVNYVINYDLPNVPEDYVHRIGRTGRAGDTGFAISFLTPENKDAMRDIEKLIGRTIEPIEIAGWDPQKSEEDAAAKATRVAARQDPEIAAAARELAKKEKRRSKPQPVKAPPVKNHPVKTQAAKTPSGKLQSTKTQPGKPDNRPGRAQRIERQTARNRGNA